MHGFRPCGINYVTTLVIDPIIQIPFTPAGLVIVRLHDRSYIKYMLSSIDEWCEWMRVGRIYFVATIHNCVSTTGHIFVDNLLKMSCVFDFKMPVNLFTFYIITMSIM